jgi:hypothetical protein
MGPTTVAGSEGSPAGMFSRMRRINASRNGSWIARCTKMRWTLMQDWPAYPKAADAIKGTAASQFASSSTITPALPPSSRATFIFAAPALSFHPTAALPVKLSILMRASRNSAGMWSCPKGTTLICPAGTPASCKTSARSSAENGVFSAGFNTIVFPEARQGATLWATRLSGKLNGVIPRITPIGKRRTRPKCPTPGGLASMRTPCPSSPDASCAAKRKVMVARSTSAAANVTGLPASATRMRTNSFRRAAIRSAMRERICARSQAGWERVCLKAACADATADSTWSASARQISPTVEPSHGLVTAWVSGEVSQRPSR